MFSFLGSLNPVAKMIDPKDECVWLLDCTAYRPIHVYPHSSEPFQAEVMAAFFKKDSGKDMSEAVANIADKIGSGSQGENKEEAERTIAQRLQPLADTIAPARSVDVKFPDGSMRRLGPGGRSAISKQTITELQQHKDREIVKAFAVDTSVIPHGPMNVYFAEPEGWLVVSGMSLPHHFPTP